MSALNFTLLAVGTPSTGSSQANWAAQILHEFGRSQATGFAAEALKGTLLGVALGTLLSIAACVLFSRIGWYDAGFRFGRLVRWTVFIATVLISAVLFGLAGFWHGAIDGSERVLSKSQLATDVFPKIAETIADAMAWIQLDAQSNRNTNTAEPSLNLEQFRSGQWELNSAQFVTQLDQLQGETIRKMLNKLKNSTLQSAPQLKGGLGEKLLHQVLDGLARLIVTRKVSSELKSWGVDRVYFAIREQLSAEAARSGNPQTIGRADISKFLVREGIVPGIMKPIRSTARAQQLPLVAIALLVLLLPPVCFRLAKRWSARKPPVVTGSTATELRQKAPSQS